MKMERRRLRGGDKSPKKELFWGALFHLLCSHRHREPLSQPVDQDYWLLWKLLRCVRELVWGSSKHPQVFISRGPEALDAAR